MNVSAVPPSPYFPGRLLRGIPWRRLAPWLLIGAAIAPMLILHGLNLWRQPQYQVFPLLYLVLGGLLYQEVRFTGQPSRARWWLATSILVTSGLLFAAAVVMYSPYVGQAAGILWLLGGILRYAPNVRLGRVAAYGALLLLTTIPVGLSARLAQSLQSVTSVLSSGVLETLRVPHARAGNVIEVVGRSLFVDEACSGIQSLFAAVCVVVVIAVVQRSPLLLSGLALASVPVWALVGNMVRIVTISAAHSWWSLNLAEGWQHDALGYLNFVLIAICLAVWIRLLSLLLAPIPLAAETHTPAIELYNRWTQWPNYRLDLHGSYLDSVPDFPETIRPAVARVESSQWSGTVIRRMSWAGALAVVLLGLVNFAFLITQESGILGPSMGAFDFELREQLPGSNAYASLPNSWPVQQYEVEERDTGSIFGNFSHVWRLRWPQGTGCVASLDFPFFIYHDVGICYRSSGWEINRYEPIGREAGVPTGEEAEGVLHFEMRRSLGAEYGYVVFTLIDEFGATIPPPQPQAVGDAVWDHIRRGPLSLLIRSLKRDKRLDRPLIQLQYFAAKKSPFSEVEREAVVQQFFGALPAMRERIAGAFQEQARR